MIEKLIQRMFAARNASHLQHWKTKSYAQHQALGKYYDGVIDLLDSYVEAHQGGFGVIGEVLGEVENVSKMIHDDIIWLTANRENIANNTPALENIVDELTALHMKTLYKLENLK